MNSINIIGRMTKDPELNYIPNSGTAVASFDIAVNDYVNKQKVTYFFSIKAWGKVAENVTNYCKKGSEVGITGKLIQRSYTNKTGNKVNVIEINASDVKFIGGNQNNNSSNKNENSFQEEIEPLDNVDAPW